MDVCDFCGCGFQFHLQAIEDVDGELKICSDCFEKETNTGEKL
jgi:hypothetical protein